MSVMQYLSGIVRGFTEIDELGILIFAQMFHIVHVIDSKLAEHDIVLAYCGDNVYKQTICYEPVSVNIDIHFLNKMGEEYVIKPSGSIDIVPNSTAFWRMYFFWTLHDDL